jgi:hypothetical protein
VAVSQSSTLPMGFTTHSDLSASDILVWGVQVENGSYATSYIPTEGSSVTRVAETNSQTVADGVMGQTEGVMFLNTNITLGGRLMLLGATGNFIEVLSTAAGKINAFVYNGSTQANILSTSTYTSGDDLKIAFAYKANDFTLYINGVQEGSDTSGSIPTLSSNSLILNNYLTSGYDTKNSYSEAKLYNTRLTNTELQNLTS